MAKTTSNHKKKLARKLLEFEKNGLLKYGKYHGKPLKFSGNKKSHAKYKKYIEQQIILKDKKIQHIDVKLARCA